MEDNFNLIQIKSFSPEGINFFPARSQKQNWSWMNAWSQKFEPRGHKIFSCKITKAKNFPESFSTGKHLLNECMIKAQFKLECSTRSNKSKISRRRFSAVGVVQTAVAGQRSLAPAKKRKDTDRQAGSKAKKKEVNLSFSFTCSPAS